MEDFDKMTRPLATIALLLALAFLIAWRDYSHG
jgi:hypothetical protein